MTRTDTTTDSKSLLRYRKSAAPVAKESFEIPEGYMTGDEFERRVKEEVTQFYKEHGLI